MTLMDGRFYRLNGDYLGYLAKNPVEAIVSKDGKYLGGIFMSDRIFRDQLKFGGEFAFRIEPNFDGNIVIKPIRRHKVIRPSRCIDI